LLISTETREQLGAIGLAFEMTETYN
jgi:hypothetical protein